MAQRYKYLQKSEVLLPSWERYRNYICMPPKDYVDEDCGKWVLHFSNFGTEMLDSTWLSLQRLLSDGTLLMLKAFPALKRMEQPRLECFTKPGKEAKWAADDIRKVLEEKRIDFTGAMYYYEKDELANEEIAHRRGYKYPSKYKNTSLGRFYKRDPLNKWKLDDDDESIPRKNCSSTSSAMPLVDSQENLFEDDEVDL